ncbi:MAG: InlB B-repeat-containing protein [Lachnospiraceae bacterium]|nr:InlB B-repeat-containing protein [Lachnospiraceae bacterium]
MKIFRKAKGLLVRLFAVTVLAAAVLMPGMTAKADGSMFDSPYVVPYHWTDPATGELKKYFTLNLPLPVDTNRDTEYVAHPLSDYFNWRTQQWIRQIPSFWEYEVHGSIPQQRIETGNVKTIRDLNVGEHYYKADRVGEVPIGFWLCEHPDGRCIHTGNQTGSWIGLKVGDKICSCVYYSGWIPYCVDCGRVLESAYVYAPREALETIDYLNVDYGYYYICPNPACHHLENEGYGQPHKCNAISPNKYVVVYDGNGAIPKPEGLEGYFDISGIMHNSYHMYNNATEYRGNPVEPVTHLTLNSYRRDKYTFVGWNTKPDGTGTPYADGAEILNLTEYNYQDIDGLIDDRGFVTLYAQWVPTESTLKIDPKEGSYDGQEGITTITQGYGANYLADPNKVTPKSIYKVSYNTHGGNAISPDSVPRKFTSWKQEAPFKGKMKENTYYFIAPNANVDTLTALYENLPITLPTPVREGYSFGGWYEDEDCISHPVGFGGDQYLATSSVTLHAKWSKLVLWSYDNYTANGRKGAADLKWEQNDSYVKSYKLYKSDDEAVTWTQIEGAGGGGVSSVSKTYEYNGANRTYSIPSTGFYEFTVYGAQGGNYVDADPSKNKTGGLGGGVTAKFYLKKGDVITVTVGGQNGYGGGGSASTSSYGKGGGATTVTSANEGLLIVAGGGGGATEYVNGEPGGAATSLVASGSSGESGNAGGGGGYLGGTAGNVVRHYCGPDCLLVHNHTDACYVKQTYEEICYLSNKHYLADPSKGSAHDCDVDGTQPLVHTTWVCNHFNATHSACGAGSSGGEMANDYYKHIVSHSGYWYCDRCKRTECPSGHKYSYNGLNESDDYHTFTAWREVLICGNPTVGCKYGYTDGQVVSSTIAYGGSSYVSPKAISGSTETGVRSGNGTVSIQSAGIGMSDANYLNGVPANDLEAPDAIDEIRGNAITAANIVVRWDEPEDNGTPYWFRAESYNAADGNKLCDSNITKNVLTTGVAGYYYTFGMTKTDPVTKSNGTFQTDRSKEVHLENEDVDYWFCVAPVDVAGNIGATTSIKLKRGSDTTGWPVKTEQVSVESFLPTDDNVYHDLVSDKWYVRADGTTPFKLMFDSYIDGYAGDTYQIDEQNFYVAYNDPDQANEYKTILPKTTGISSLVGTKKLAVNGFVRSYFGGTSLLIDASNTGASRGYKGTKNSFFQGFTAPTFTSGTVLAVTPGAGAGNGLHDGYSHSLWSEDVLNTLRLYPDGEAPVITGNQDFAALTVINDTTLTDHAIEFNASDAISGLRSLSVKIINQDNGAVRTAADDDHDGKVTFTFDPTSAIFDGDVVFEVTAIDNVGNRNLAVYGKTEYTLMAEILHAGYNPAGVTTFACGDPAVLHAETTGYADTIMIEVPDEIKSGYPADMVDFYGLIEYRTPIYANFVVPDDCPAGNYTFVVHSYKNGVELEARPVMITITNGTSGGGSVRVRIR